MLNLSEGILTKLVRVSESNLIDVCSMILNGHQAFLVGFFRFFIIESMRHFLLLALAVFIQGKLL